MHDDQLPPLSRPRLGPLHHPGGASPTHHGKSQSHWTSSSVVEIVSQHEGDEEPYRPLGQARLFSYPENIRCQAQTSLMGGPIRAFHLLLAYDLYDSIHFFIFLSIHFSSDRLFKNTNHFCTYDFFLIRARTTNGSQ